MASKFRQEMPPNQGYGPVDWKQRIPRDRIGGRMTFGLIGAGMLVSWAAFVWETKRKRALKLEMNEARIAVEPLIEAERHRLYLTQLRENRDAENDLMSERKDWTTGTWRGKPIYHNVSGRFINVPMEELYAHAKPGSINARVNEKLRH